MAVEVSAHHVHGEPIPAEEAFGADFEPFAVGGRWGPAWDTTWFRIKGTVPPEWSGGQVALGFVIGSAGSTGFGAEALLWREGRPVQGLSPNHREYLVAERATGGETVEVFVEAAANPPSPFGANPWPLLLADPEGAPLFTLEQADLHLRDPAFESFWHDFRVLVELLGELPEGDPRPRTSSPAWSGPATLSSSPTSQTAGVPPTRTSRNSCRTGRRRRPTR